MQENLPYLLYYLSSHLLITWINLALTHSAAQELLIQAFCFPSSLQPHHQGQDYAYVGSESGRSGAVSEPTANPGQKELHSLPVNSHPKPLLVFPELLPSALKPFQRVGCVCVSQFIFTSLLGILLSLIFLEFSVFKGYLECLDVNLFLLYQKSLFNK